MQAYRICQDHFLAARSARLDINPRPHHLKLTCSALRWQRVILLTMWGAGTFTRSHHHRLPATEANMSSVPAPDRVTLPYLQNKKRLGQPITMLTAYDFPTAVLLDQAGIDIVFVGDSVGTNVLGYRSPQEVTMADMLHHARAVRRGVQRGFFLVDMPFMSYQISAADAARNAGEMVQLAGAEGVKMEGGQNVLPQVAAVVGAGVPVMGHIGFTPQSQTSQYYLYSRRHGTVPKYQGKGPRGASQLLDQALLLEDAGIFALVLEMVTEEVAQSITERVAVPVIGIGAGRHCDGQVLTSTDLLGIGSRELRLARCYAPVGDTMLAAFEEFRDDVAAGRFPREENLQHMDPEKLAQFRLRLADPAVDLPQTDETT
jgi:3-methyl-2-oxobutanoate hydroxymethyltransferase